MQQVWDGEPSNFQWEQEGLNHIKNSLDSLPIPYYARQCFTFTALSGAVRECDLLIAVPAGFFLLELKAHRGRARNIGSTWSFDGDSTINNPLHATDQKAKELKGLLQRVNGGSKPDVPFLDAAVFLSAPDLVCDFDEIQQTKVYGREGLKHQTGLDEIVTDLLNRPPRPHRRTPQAFLSHLPKLLERIGVTPVRTERRIGVYKLEAKALDSGPTWQDFLAGNSDFPEDPPRRVRVYPIAQGASEEDRTSMRRAVEREFKSLGGISHPGIVAVENRGMVDDIGPAVVFHHGKDWQRLDQFMATGGEWLPVETRVEMVRQLADTLRHAHGQRLYHRALAASSVWVELDGHYPRLRIADWQGAARRSPERTNSTTSWGKVAAHIGPAAGSYIAPEAPNNQADPIQLDIFGLGALAYLILTGKEPAETREGLAELLKAQEKLVPSAVSDDMTPTMDALVSGATSHHQKRFADVAKFMEALDAVEEELQALYEDPVADPLLAGPGDVVGRYRIRRVLGSGSTGRALLAQDTEKSEGEDHHEVVLKVALDVESAERALEYEAEVLRSVRATHIVELLDGPIELGGRKVLVEAVAGEESLAQYLRSEGSLTAEELKGWTRDLFGALRDLEDHGLRHRDLKPDNLGIRKGKNKKRRQLFLFDFSLASAEITNLKAGTGAYRDPFLGPPRRTSYDAAAEYYALAVTLYEMATGELPSWGDGLTDPADLPETETVPQIRADAFDPSIAEGLKAFFLKALHRDAKQRFADLEEMEDAFRKALRSEPEPAPPEPPQPERRSRLASDLPLSQTDLSEKALAAALKRLRVDTVGQLSELPGTDIQSLRGVGLRVRNELQQKASAWRAELHLAEAAPSTDAPEDAKDATVDAIAAELIRVKGEEDYRRCVRALVGLPDGNRPSPVPVWAPVDRIESATGLTAAQIAQYRNQVREGRWRKLASVNALRKLIEEILTEHGRVIEASRLAAAVLVRRGSARSERAERLAGAGAAVYAAVHVEDAQDDPAFVLHRRSDGSALVALTDGEDQTKPTELELFDYATKLGLEAERLVAGLGESDPLPQPAEAIAALRGCASLDGVLPTDTDLVRLAADATRLVSVTPRLELYPTDLDPKRAVALTQLSAYLDDVDGVNWADLIERVKARFGDLQDFPDRKSDLMDLLYSCDLDVEEKPADKARLRLREGSRTSSVKASRSRFGSASGPDDAAQFTKRLAKAVDSGGFRAVKVGVRPARAAAAWLADRPGVYTVDVQREFLRLLRDYVTERGNKPPWETLLKADTLPAPPLFTKLLEEVWRRLEAALFAAAEREPVLFLQNATPLARYAGGQEVLRALITGARRPEQRPNGLWLLCPTDAIRQVAHLDGHNIGAIDAAGEQLEFPVAVLKPSADTASPQPAL